MFKKVTATLGVLVLTGCATSASIMESYKGKDVTDAILDYGAPSNIIEISEGKRIYQWGMNIKSHTPATSYTNGSVSSYTNNLANFNAVTQHYGGYTSTNSCIYNLYAEKVDSSWVVTGYKKPRRGCNYIHTRG